MSIFIDPSLAQGIRRAYLESLEDKERKMLTTLKHDSARNPGHRIRTLKGFHKAVGKVREVFNKSGMRTQEIYLESGRKALWASLFLSREKQPDGLSPNGMTPTGRARVYVFGTTFHPRENWIKSMSICITEHAIDRVIQRAKLVALPVTKSDLDAIDTQLSDPLLWAVAAFFILSELPLHETPALTVLLPSEYGFFLGDFSLDPIEFTVRTFVDYEKTWPEQQEALSLLRSVSDAAIAHYAGQILKPGHIPVEHGAFDRTILKCWREYGWRIKEKLGRPGEEDKLWSGH